MAKDKYAYVCQECGYDSPKWLGQCPNCKTWNSMVEEKIVKSSTSRAAGRGQRSQSKPQKISHVQTENLPRTQTNIEELNRVLGGGVVPGSLVLIGGDPGIGKSTLLLQLSAELSRQGQEVLYVTGEESDSQVKMRAERLNALDSDFYIYPETDLEAIKEAIEYTKAGFVVIDSIQTMTHPDVESSAGSVSQVRESTAELMRLAKSQQIAIFLVGHVTKQGSIAGPRILEHMVDTVLYFEGDQNYSYRMLRAVKNRYGSTNEIGVFEMRESGLKEVTNPSQLFLEERLEGSSGSSVVVSMEGTRPILAEIQALVTPTAFGNARRTASGVDYNRVTLIMAVLEKRAGLLLQNQDAYVKASGGVRLNEPAIDLAIAVSLASSYRDKQTQAEDFFIGEIGLTGEVRRVNRIEQRVQEAAKLGFKRAFIPYHNLEGWDYPKNIHVVGVRTLAEALNQAF